MYLYNALILTEERHHIRHIVPNQPHISTRPTRQHFHNTLLSSSSTIPSIDSLIRPSLWHTTQVALSMLHRPTMSSRSITTLSRNHSNRAGHRCTTTPIQTRCQHSSSQRGTALTRLLYLHRKSNQIHYHHTPTLKTYLQRNHAPSRAPRLARQSI